MAQIIVKSVLEEPVKEAVLEALEEYEYRIEVGTQEQSADISSEEGNRVLRPGIVVPVLGLVAVALYLTRRGDNRLSTQLSTEDDATTPSRGVDTQSKPRAGDEMGSHGQGGDDEKTEREPDEAATAS